MYLENRLARRPFLLFLTMLAVAAAAPAQVFWTEDFDDPNNQTSIRIVSGFGNTDGGFCVNDYFLRTNLNVGDHPEFAGDFTNLSNSYYWRAEDFDSCMPATGNITWTGIDITGRTNLTLRGRFGSRETSTWENTDFIRLRWQIDGGGFQDGLCFAGGGGAGSDLTVDADCNGTGDAAGTELTTVLADFAVILSGAGTSLDLLLESACDSGAEEFAFDYLRLEENQDILFLDGFEGGNADAWSTTVP